MFLGIEFDNLGDANSWTAEKFWVFFPVDVLALIFVFLLCQWFVYDVRIYHFVDGFAAFQIINRLISFIMILTGTQGATVTLRIYGILAIITSVVRIGMCFEKAAVA